MIYLKTFKLAPHRTNNPNAYPYHVLAKMADEALIFHKITVLAGSNGAGKSTILNVIANKLRLNGAESSDFNWYSRKYLQDCLFQLGDDEEDDECSQLPSHSKYLKSEDILYEVKKKQQEQVLREAYIYQKAKLGTPLEQLDALKQSKDTDRQIEIIKFANEMYSNGETAIQLFEDMLSPDALYLLDEPETSLSFANQIKMAEVINNLARYCRCQFIIATHSPFMLGCLNAIIYDLDAPTLRTVEWTQLENVQQFYSFFKERQHEFE